MSAILQSRIIHTVKLWKWVSIVLVFSSLVEEESGEQEGALGRPEEVGTI